MTPEAVGSIFAGLTGLITALAGFVAIRSRHITTDHKTLRKQVQKLRQAVLLLDAHTFRLELEIARTGGNIPDRPAALLMLLQDDEDDDAKGSNNAA